MRFTYLLQLQNTGMLFLCCNASRRIQLSHGNSWHSFSGSRQLQLKVAARYVKA